VPYYDDRDRLWDSIPVVNLLDFDERQTADWLFTQILDDVEFRHIAPQDSPYWEEFKEFFGFVQDGDVWDWNDFKEWYDQS
jgi:hypothetical protein